MIKNMECIVDISRESWTRCGPSVNFCLNCVFPIGFEYIKEIILNKFNLPEMMGELANPREMCFVSNLIRFIDIFHSIPFSIEIILMQY